MLRFYTYRLPFKKPYAFAENEYLYREGIILAYTEGDITAFGEAAPLPGLSTETFDQVKEVLNFNRIVLYKSLQNGTANEVLEVLDQLHDLPSLIFAIDTLIHDLTAKKKRKSLHLYLFPEKTAVLKSNTTLPFQEIDEAIDKAEVMVAEGFETIKIKVGRNFDQEHELLLLLRNKFPHVKLRIDANQAWTVEEAIKNLNSIKSLTIEYCEQPVGTDDVEGLRKVKKYTTIPIAIDESGRNKMVRSELLKTNAVDVLILKPTLFGSFKNLFVTKHMAESHNIKVVFTTCLESNIGRAAVAVLSSGLGSKDYAQGLATGQFFQQDVGPENWLNESTIRFQEKAGLGISVDLNSFEEIQE